MKSIPSLLQSTLFLFSLAALAACSPQTPPSAVIAEPPHQLQALTWEEPETGEENTLIAAESEQDLQEELAGLERLGGWEAQARCAVPKPEPEAAGNEDSVAMDRFDFPILLNKQVEFYLELFQNKQHKTFQAWLDRSSRYLPLIHRELSEAGLPLDLAYLAMIESGYHPSAVSPAQAVGMWQFIDGTGSRYGLQIDSWVDERRDPEKATRAAVAYLANLHARYNDWHLAVAAYNAGEGKIDTAIERYGCRDFWEIAQYDYLALETKRYVPKLIAAILIAREPQRYGFSVSTAVPVEYDLVKVPGRTDLEAVALSAQASLKQIKELNNDLKKNLTPASRSHWTVRVPKGSRDMVASNLKRLQPVTETGYKTHVVGSNETLTAICDQYQLSKTTLLKANNLRTGTLKKGQRLQIPYQETRYVLLDGKESEKVLVADSPRQKGKRVVHALRKDETISRVARQYNVTPEQIIEWNDIKDTRRLAAGRQLTLYTGQSVVSEHAPAVASAAPVQTKQLIVAGKIKKRPDGQQNVVKTAAAKTVYKVKNGDSLWSIAKKFQISTAELRRWNGLKSDRLQLGESLIVGKS